MVKMHENSFGGRALPGQLGNTLPQTPPYARRSQLHGQ